MNIFIFDKLPNIVANNFVALFLSVFSRVFQKKHFFKIELLSLNHPCHWVIGGHKKFFSVIDSKMTRGERFLVFKGIYKGKFPKIDFWP